MFSENIMSHFPDARKLRTESMTKGISWADQEIQKVMISSAQLKAEKALQGLEEKGMYDATLYGQVWIADNIAYLAEKIIDKPTTEIVKAYMDFPSKFRMEDGSIVSVDDYMKNTSYYKANGLRLSKEIEGKELTPEQKRANEFVVSVGRARSRASTVAFIILTEMLDVVMSPEGDLSVTGCAGHIMSNIIHQLIVLKGVELKKIVEVPSVSLICDISKWTTSKGDVSVKGGKLLEALGIKSIKSISPEGVLVEGRALMEFVCSNLKDLDISNGDIEASQELKTKLQDLRVRSVSSACDARPVLEKPVSDGMTNSYREAPLKDYLVGGYRPEVSQSRVSSFDREAVDRIQGTAFNINRKVLDTIKKALSAGVVIEDKLNVPMPPDFPPLEDFPKLEEYKDRTSHNEAKRVWFESEENRKRYTKWKTKAEGRKQKQQASVSVNDMNRRTLEIAQWYADWGGPFYLPVFMDYRTRMYYCPTILNPQSSKLAKSLFIACRGKVIGTEKAMEYWLVNFSGSMKKVKSPDGTEYAGDKSPWNVATFAGRQELKTGAMIASDPLSQESLERWTTQDNPFEYLAHCFECPGILEEGIGFTSRLFISMDGSCNAYQHAAGYLADRKTGSLVNLTYRGPDEAPEDLYGKVSEGFTRSLRLENQFHKLFKFYEVINRGSCKRITMCQGYGLTPSGAKKYGAEEIEKYTKESDESNPFDIIGREGAYASFSEGVMETVESVAPAIVKVKEALQKVGELACNPTWNSSGVVSWTTYTGTKVFFTKKKEISKKATLVSGNKRIFFVYKKRLDSVDQVEVSNAMAPNYTHSRDADHLRLAIMAMPEGCSYLVIHDSFGTLAADAPLFCEKIKETFIEMYKDKDPLEILIRETLGGCLGWLGKDLDWLRAGGIDELVAQCGRSGKYSGKDNEEIRKVIKGLKLIMDNIKQVNDLDFDEIRTCIYPFR